MVHSLHISNAMVPSAHRFLWPTVLLLVLAQVGVADAEKIKVQRADKFKQAKQREIAITKARSQRIAPGKFAALQRAIEKHSSKPNSIEFRDAVSRAPLAVRVEVFKKLAKATTKEPVNVASRRVRGMVKKGKTNRVAKASKTYFEVTATNLEVFRQVMGQNVVWFATSMNPGHLHTLVADQGGGKNFAHNTYGEFPLEPAAIKNTQMAFPAQLTDKEMDRFVRYLNAGVESGRQKVYGFKTRSGQLVCDTACTDWASSAPVGKLKRWIRTLDKNVKVAVKAGVLDKTTFGQGLHAAIVKTPAKADRKALITKVLNAKGISKWSKNSARLLGEEFTQVKRRWPRRPVDLVGRESLATTLGVSRSQDPAKFTYDLFMSTKVPVAGVFNPERSTSGWFRSQHFGFDNMGQIGPSGNVENTTTGAYARGLGVVPADRQAPGSGGAN